jgi:2-polyprenyl-3-methyl-5-hydroxy-6-metoxy-1,4-benzoquinol methylase
MKATAFHSGAHLEEMDLRPVESACPLCSFRGERSAVLRLQSEPCVSLVACPNCGGFSASRLPTEEALRRYYSKYYQQGIFRDIEKVTFDEPLRFAKHLLRRAKPFLKRRAPRILDFGGGGGNLSMSIARLLLEGGASHVDVVLVDYNAALARSDSPDISLECHDDLASANAADCDLVLASGILEHIPYPQEPFTRLLSAIRPGGVFYARTPCVVSLFRVLQGIGLPMDFTYPAHLHDMGESYWSSVLRVLPPQFHHYSIIWSHPSIVETTLRKNAMRTVAAYVMKAPWRLLGKSYPFVGGWEVLIRRAPSASAVRSEGPA